MAELKNTKISDTLYVKSLLGLKSFTTEDGHVLTLPSVTGSLYIKPTAGIPKTDLASDVQTVLNSAFSPSNLPNQMKVEHSNEANIFYNNNSPSGKYAWLNYRGSGTQVETIKIGNGNSNGGYGNLQAADYLFSDGSSIKTALNSKYVKPSGGIPKTDLASAVQTSLNTADVLSFIVGTDAVNDNILLGGTAWNDVIVHNSIVPQAGVTGKIDLGDASGSFKDLYLSGQIKKSTYSLTLPSKTGTIALTSDIPSLSGYVTISGTETISGKKTFTHSNGLLVRTSNGIGITSSSSSAKGWRMYVSGETLMFTYASSGIS